MNARFLRNGVGVGLEMGLVAGVVLVLAGTRGFQLTRLFTSSIEDKEEDEVGLEGLGSSSLNVT
jgi:hypothetical protein